MIYKTIKSARIDTSSIDPSLNKDLSDYAKTAYDSLEEIAELVPELNDVIGSFENDVLVPLKNLKITSSHKPVKSFDKREQKKVNSGLDYAQKGDVVIAKKGTKVVGFIGQNADKTFYYGFGNPGNASGVIVVNDFDSAARQLEKRL